MKTVIRIAIISILMAFAVPVFAGGSAVMIYTCEQADTASEADVVATAAEWLALAKTIKGGEKLETRVMFPVAASMPENDFMIAVIAPSFSEWGVFQDNYEAANVADEEKKFANIAACDSSALWESFKQQ